MATAHNHPTARAYDIAAWLLGGGALFLVLTLHLLPALLAGLLVHELVHLLAPRLHILRIHQAQGKLAAVGLLALGVVLLLTLVVAGITAFVRSEAGSLPTLLQKMAEIVERWHTVLPAWVVESLPEDVEALRETAVDGLREHAGALQHAGAAVGRTLVDLLMGMVIGALVALYDVQPLEPLGPLARALQARANLLGEAFRRVVFAQVRISTVNTLLTALYLLVALPLAGVHLPLTKTTIAGTWVVGLLPIVGNLVSNTIIVILSLSVSLAVAVASLVLLIVIHKLEYVLNAYLVGTQIHAHAWELLLAMLVMEAAFGLPGLIAAPIYYAYLKAELVSQQLV